MCVGPFTDFEMSPRSPLGKNQRKNLVREDNWSARLLIHQAEPRSLAFLPKVGTGPSTYQVCESVRPSDLNLVLSFLCP